MRFVQAAAAAVLLAPLLAFAACRGATELALDVRTNVPCTDAAQWQGIAVYVGEPGVDVESKAPALTSMACDASGVIGTLIVVPTGADNQQVGIRVVAGLTHKPEDCAAAGYAGCIVARRAVTYLPHESQSILIDLTSDCTGTACDPFHTCFDGACTDTVDVPVTTEPAGTSADASGTSGTTVRCGDEGVRCPANDPSLVCCVQALSEGEQLDAGPLSGACVAPAACDTTNATLFCDDSSDCPAGDAGDPNVCCETLQDGLTSSMLVTALAVCLPSSLCYTRQGEITEMCQDRGGVCGDPGTSCGEDPNLTGYFDCRIR